jgi:hypothetical protein
VKELLNLADEDPGVFGLLGALAEDWHNFPRPAQRFGVADGGGS